MPLIQAVVNQLHWVDTYGTDELNMEPRRLRMQALIQLISYPISYLIWGKAQNALLHGSMASHCQLILLQLKAAETFN